MLTIIIGIIASVIVTIILLNIIKNDALCSFVSLCGFLEIILSVFLGLCVPFSGYNDWKLIKETELVSLSNASASGGTGFIYVSLSADNAYTYRFEVDSTFGTKSSKEYKTSTIINDYNEVIEIEDPACQKPMLMEYNRTAKKSIWTFGLLADETSYVFYVPEGTINKDIKLE